MQAVQVSSSADPVHPGRAGGAAPSRHPRQRQERPRERGSSAERNPPGEARGAAVWQVHSRQ